MTHPGRELWTLNFWYFVFVYMHVFCLVYVILGYFMLVFLVSVSFHLSKEECTVLYVV